MSAAPLDLDALERLATAVKADIAEQGASDAWVKATTLTGQAFLEVDAEFIAACSPDVILALVAAARRGVGGTELRDAAGRAFDEIDINGASEDSARCARNILGPALTAYDRSARAHPEDTTDA